MKNQISSVAALVLTPLFLLSSELASAQWMVNDPQLNMQTRMNHVQTIAKYVQQIAHLKSQLEEMKRQYSAVTGSYGRGVPGMVEAITSSSIVPGSWQEVIELQKKGAFSSKQAYYERLIKTLPIDLFADPKSKSATTYKLSTDSVRAAMAGGDALYGEVQIHLNNIAQLSKEVDKTTNIKDASDLQNRIAVENGMMQTALAKMNVLNMNLQANLANQQNQATADSEQFFKWED